MKSSLLRLSNIIQILLVAGAIIVASSRYAPAAAATEPDTLAAAVSLSSTDVANGRVALLEIDLNELGPAVTDLKAKFRDQSIALIQHPIKSSGIYAGLVGIPLSATPEKAVRNLKCGLAACHSEQKESCACQTRKKRDPTHLYQQQRCPPVVWRF
jgi:hypothetical protein